MVEIPGSINLINLHKTISNLKCQIKSSIPTKINKKNINKPSKISLLDKKNKDSIRQGQNCQNPEWNNLDKKHKLMKPILKDYYYNMKNNLKECQVEWVENWQTHLTPNSGTFQLSKNDIFVFKTQIHNEQSCPQPKPTEFHKI